MKALVLAGGFGIRLKEVINDRPKVMAPVNGKPFLEHVIFLLRSKGFGEIVISLGYLGDFIKSYFGDGKDFGVKIEYSSEDYPLGTGGAVKNSESFFNEPFLVLNGDTYLETDLVSLMDFQRKSKSLVTVALVKRKATSKSGLILLEKSGKIRSFNERQEKNKECLVNAGYYVFDTKIFNMLKKGEKISLEKEVFPKLAKKNLLNGYLVKEDFLDVGKPENYERAKEIFSSKKIKTVETKAPVRISFAGGGTDFSSYFLKYGGSVTSAGIDIFSHVLVKENQSQFIKINLKDFKSEKIFEIGKILPYNGDIFDICKAVINRIGLNFGVDINIWSDFPIGAGLGGSSSVTLSLVSALSALEGHLISKEEAVRMAIEIEREILKIPGGWQDQYTCSLGGINFIEFGQNGEVKVRLINLTKARIMKLEESLSLFYLGGKRSEKEQQTALSDNIKNDEKTQKSLNSLKKLSRLMKNSLKNGSIKNFGRLLHSAWLAKKMSNSKISGLRIDELYELAMKDGAYGGKLLGAGGGGCLLICAPKKAQEVIIKEFKKRGIARLPFHFNFTGLEVNNKDES